MTVEVEDRQNLENFLQELILTIDRPEAIDLLLGILSELKKTTVESKAAEGVSTGSNGAERPDRYDIFKMMNDKVVRIGFVKGVENAERVLPGLHTLEGRVYFLHESGVAWNFVTRNRIAP